MSELCINGHVRTPENTSLVKRGRGEKRKRVCLDCRRSRNTGRPAAHELTAHRTTELHEDVEDLLRFGATLAELEERAGFSTLKRLKESLRRRGRDDLLQRIEEMQDKAGNSERDLFLVNGGQLTEGRSRVR